MVVEPHIGIRVVLKVQVGVNMDQKSMVDLQRYFLVLQTIGESTTVNVYELGRVVEALQKIKTNPAVISPGNIR